MKTEGDTLRRLLAEELGTLKTATGTAARAAAVAALVGAAAFLVLVESVVAYLERENVH